ncbi:MAG: septum formation inhibitor Maf [Oscillospiraceae bacterium]|nr:septum formation inhibitor Maf [Oscillospiraceae bacterium]
MKQLILASASPRRKQLLEMMGLAFRVVPAAGEEHPCADEAPDAIVKALALAKGREVAAHVPQDTIVLAADTIVWLDGQLLGKPKTEEEAVHMLRCLSGKTHEVYTGVALISEGEELAEAERTEVTFRDLTEEEIWRYVASGEPMDKAGAYGAQGRAAALISRIDGDFFNVVGLPLCMLGQMLAKKGVSIL